jgi:predicted porin
MIFAAEGETPLVKGNVELYGQAKLSVDTISTDAAAPADRRLNRVSSNSSRLGVKGTEAIADGLSAVFQLELGVNFDGSSTTVDTPGADGKAATADDKTTGISTITYRNSYAGLSYKNAGTLIFGIHDTPYKLATGSLDAFGDTMGDYNAIIGNVNGATDFDLRPKDAVMFMSPKLAGFQIMAATSTTGQENSNGADPNATEYSGSAAYAGGPVFVSLAYETHRNKFGSFDGLHDKVAGAKAGLGLTFGGTRLGLVYEKLKDDKADSKFTRNAYYAALSRKIGNETLKAAYGKARDGEDPATETGAAQFTVGIDHALSKRTTVYALYTKMRNNKDATYGLGQGGAGGAYVPGAGAKPSDVSIGINHGF